MNPETRMDLVGEIKAILEFNPQLSLIIKSAYGEAHCPICGFSPDKLQDLLGRVLKALKESK